MKNKTRREDFVKKHPKALVLPFDGKTPRCCCLLLGYTKKCPAHSGDDFPDCCAKCWEIPVKEGRTWLNITSGVVRLAFMRVR